MVGRSSRIQSVLKGIILMFDESGSSEMQNWLRIKNRGNIIATECLENLAPLYETEVAKLETLIDGTTTAYKNNDEGCMLAEIEKVRLFYEPRKMQLIPKLHLCKLNTKTKRPYYAGKLKELKRNKQTHLQRNRRRPPLPAKPPVMTHLKDPMHRLRPKSTQTAV